MVFPTILIPTIYLENHIVLIIAGWFPWGSVAAGIQDIPVVFYETQCSNIKGTLLVLDVGSLNPRSV